MDDNEKKQYLKSMEGLMKFFENKLAELEEDNDERAEYYD